MFSVLLVGQVCDFGMSRAKQHTVIHTKETGGSPLWMAPECLRGVLILAVD